MFALLKVADAFTLASAQIQPTPCHRGRDSARWAALGGNQIDRL